MNDVEAVRSFAADRIGDLPVPAESGSLIGHHEVADALCARYKAGRLHHAYLITGPKGIGKATLALNFAAHLLRYTQGEQAPGKLETPPDNDVISRRIAGGGHPNLLYLARAYDEKQKKFKTEITVDVVRKTVAFFGTTTGEPGCRVCIVDAADEMNRNAANALLKVLEEPPAKTVFLVISHASGRLLPTIRSRCQQLALKPLSVSELTQVINRFDLDGGIDAAKLEEAAKLSGGSVRRALQLLLNDGLALQKRIETLMAGNGEPNWTGVHKLAGELAPRAADEKFRLFLDLYFEFLSSSARKQLGNNLPISQVAHWTDLWEKTLVSVRETDAFNLDRKQMILSLFERMRTAA